MRELRQADRHGPPGGHARGDALHRLRDPALTPDPDSGPHAVPPDQRGPGRRAGDEAGPDPTAPGPDPGAPRAAGPEFLPPAPPGETGEGAAGARPGVEPAAGGSETGPDGEAGAERAGEPEGGLSTGGRSAVLVGIVVVLAALAFRAGILERRDLIFFAVLIPSVILHEVSHGVVALAFGDDTAKRAGRLTLNPVPHVDPFGTVLLPAMMVLSGGGAFGYAKPVPVRVDRLRRPRSHSLVVSLAGPATNIVLVVLLTVAVRMLGPDNDGLLAEVLVTAGLANVVLAVFNLIPLPPLDGSAVVERFLPDRYLATWYQFRQYSMFVLLALFVLRPGAFGQVIRPAVEVWARFLA